MQDKEPTPGGLVRFHTAHKLAREAGPLVPASRHDPRPPESTVAWHYTEMDRLLADAGKRDWDELTAEHGTLLMEGLAVPGTRGERVNVLQHLMGFLKNHLSGEDKAYRR